MMVTSQGISPDKARLGLLAALKQRLAEMGIASVQRPCISDTFGLGWEFGRDLGLWISGPGDGAHEASRPSFSSTGLSLQTCLGASLVAKVVAG